MKKVWSRGRFPVEVTRDAVAKSELARKLKAKVKERLARVEPKRLRRWCLGVMAGMLIWDVVLLSDAGARSSAVGHFSAISSVATVDGHRPPVKAFGTVWDCLMADPAMKLAWDSLLKVRPGLRDTVARLQRSDSERMRK
jgi:hypothetical protein